MNKIFKGEEVGVIDIAESRNIRQAQQFALLKSNKTLISFCLNIPGPIKQSFYLHKVFLSGLNEVKNTFNKEIKHIEIINPKTGSEAKILLDINSQDVKDKCILIEENHPLGRLFDLDVLDLKNNNLIHLERAKPRKCLICNDEAKLCARSRKHSLIEMQEKVTNLFIDYEASNFASLCKDALISEVNITPKPGLVDRANNGSHKDMNYESFMNSANALEPYFKEMYITSFRHEGNAKELFLKLRAIGLEAEKAMYKATDNINTHMGMIFSLAIIIGAYASIDAEVTITNLKQRCKQIARYSLNDYSKDTKPSGARLIASQGFAIIFDEALKELENNLINYQFNEAAILTLLFLMANIDDNNIIRRSDNTQAAYLKKEAKELLNDIKMNKDNQNLIITKVKELDKQYQQRWLSPGGSADLLALCILIHSLKQENLIN